MRTISVALVLLLTSALANAVCDPPGQFRIVTANASPGIPKDSFARKPIVQYRAGNGRTRIEEMADPAEGLHQLFVTHWPDVWVVNLLDKTGEHVKDDSPKPGVHVPVLTADPSLGLPAAWDSLEYGCEWEFFAANKAVQTPSPSEKRAMMKHQLTEGEWRVTLVTERDSQVPWALMLSKSGNVVHAIRYLAYEHQDEVDAALFAKPEGVKFTEPLK